MKSEKKSACFLFLSVPPPGSDMLMKGAGRDSSSLFSEFMPHLLVAGLVVQKLLSYMFTTHEFI